MRVSHALQNAMCRENYVKNYYFATLVYPHHMHTSGQTHTKRHVSRVLSAETDRNKRRKHNIAETLSKTKRHQVCETAAAYKFFLQLPSHFLLCIHDNPFPSLNAIHFGCKIARVHAVGLYSPPPPNSPVQSSAVLAVAVMFLEQR